MARSFFSSKTAGLPLTLSRRNLSASSSGAKISSSAAYPAPRSARQLNSASGRYPRAANASTLAARLAPARAAPPGLPPPLGLRGDHVAVLPALVDGLPSLSPRRLPELGHL